MAGENQEQERFEDYLELERYISELQAGQVAHPPQGLTPAQERIYRMAALFHAASSDDMEPHAEFAASLHARLLSQDTLSSPPAQLEQTAPAPSPIIEPQHPQNNADRRERSTKKVRFFSRRSLLTGSAVAAASLAVGAGTTAAIDRQRAASTNQPASQQSTSYPASTLVTGPTTRVAVATLAQLGDQAVKFVTDSIVGYVMLNDDGSGEGDADKVIAMSAACTHMGCIVKWNNQDRHFHCPCHGGTFDEYGRPTKGSPLKYLTSLPRLKTHVEHGTVYVEIPAPDSSGAW